MALTKEDLQAIRAIVHDEVQEQLAPVHEKLDHLESSINYAATDAQTSIKRHEKEFHMV